MFERRGITLPPSNLKQAWVIPSGTIIPNDHGTAPGWWVDREDGRIIVALPGPPREMQPMWADWVLPRLRAAQIDGRRKALQIRNRLLDTGRQEQAEQ